GNTLGHYQITNQLGKGGMGEVFRAKDQKLGRDVAIKVLPEEFAKDADRVARFQREAKLLASLNHANIAAIHGLEESSGTSFLVLELVEGETLADHIRKGPIPVEESLKLALQIAEALEAAHEKGVIHRDLKPANIKVTPDGKVKVLDFGLAKAYAGEQAELNLSNSPTLSDMATQQGVILGTAAYMSPEQAKGKVVDKRADIWAFGCVLYEMLTGRVAFQGEDVSEILASAIKGDVKLDLLPANIHPRVREAVTRCLQRELKKRYSSIADARYEIEQTLADPGGVLVCPVTTVQPRRKLRTMLLCIAAAVVLSLMIGGVAAWKLKPSEPRRVMRFDYELSEGQQFTNIASPALAISPDGSRFVYGTTKGLYLRSVDALDARLIAGTDKDSTRPFFSPDGQWIGYFSTSDQKLKKVAISGGAPVALCDTGGNLTAASWDLDEKIVYSDYLNGIMQISANGGTPERLVKGSYVTMSKEGLPVSPQMLPDGKTLLFTNSFSNVADSQIVVQSLKSGERKILVKGGTDARYLATGHIVYSLRNNIINNIFAVPFNPDRMKVTGGPVSILQGIGNAAVSNSGTLVYVLQPKLAAGSTGAASSEYTLVWVDRGGKEEPVLTTPNSCLCLRMSPDATRMALAFITNTNEDIWIWDIARKTRTRLTFDDAKDYTPIWTHDSQWIFFGSSRNGTFSIYRKPANGTGQEEKLISVQDREIWPWSWSGDGKSLLLTEAAFAPMQSDISMLSMESNRARTALLSEKYFETDPQISPDGQWMAYSSDESGQYEVYVRGFPDVNKDRWQVSNGGGVSPLWSPDGRELFYRSGDATMAVAVITKPTFKPGNPKTLFTGMYFSYRPYGTAYTPWDISPDGKRFIMVKPPKPVDGAAEKSSSTVPQPKINIVVNWFEELKRQVPVK
ncbi:MAG: serine/threonine protein kinase, partial [Acidobacteria bacterium]|nr:serine/threonine protein kinase [Acidobacteriota bacterium]